MKIRELLAIVMGAALVTGACGDGIDEDALDQDIDRTPVTEPADSTTDAMPPAGVNQQVISGSLGRVDPDARTFTLNAEGRQQTFHFNDATDVSGMAGTQGLAGREGANVTVYYRTEDDVMTATRIVMNGAAEARQ
jgi:hypothetical protein